MSDEWFAPAGVPVPGARVHVDFRKWPDRKHWQYAMEVLGHDTHGLWLWAPRGTVAYRGEEGPMSFQKSFVKVVTGDWWAANFIESPDRDQPPEVYVDIVQPASWHDGRVKMVDLDLDIRKLVGGNVEVLDEDEFLQHQVEWSYPAELVEGARRAADRLYGSVVNREEPFGEAGRRWLEDSLRRFGPDAPQGVRPQ